MLVYFANHSHNALEKKYFQHVVERIENNSFEVFWPERNIKIKAGEKNQRRYFLANCKKALESSEVVVFILDGRDVDDEARFELGMAYAMSAIDKRKLLVGFDMDSRPEMIENKSGDLVMSVFDCIPKTEYDMIDCLKSYLVTVNRNYN